MAPAEVKQQLANLSTLLQLLSATDGKGVNKGKNEKRRRKQRGQKGMTEDKKEHEPVFMQWVVEKKLHLCGLFLLPEGTEKRAVGI